MNALAPFPVSHAHAIAASEPATRWLIDGLWGFDAVGILGGEPKCCKSLCALTIAVAVAAGRACLGGHQALRTGPVLIFAAEDAPTIVRDRISLLCAGMEVDLARVPIHVITEPRLRLDDDTDRQRLGLTVAQYRPALLILDPFVRLHRVDENIAGEVAPILDGLRQLQRTYGCAILVVHHARKSAAHVRSGQALRGSSEFHAWGDSNLFLRRQQDVLSLDIEHRAAAAPDPLMLRLRASDTCLVLQPLDQSQDPPAEEDPQARLLHVLASAEQPLTRREIQARVRLRASTVGSLLEQLESAGAIARSNGRYQRIPSAVVS